MLKKLIILLFIIIFTMSSQNIYARKYGYFVCRTALSPNCKYIGIGRIDNKIILFDREAQKILKVIESKLKPLNWDISFTPDSKCFIFQTPDLFVNFYDIEKDEIINRIQLDDNFDSIAFYKDMSKMIWGGTKGKIEVVDLKTLERKVLKIEHPNPAQWEAPVSSILLSPDEEYFLTTTYSNSGPLSHKEPEGDIRPGVDVKKGVAPWNLKHLGANLWDAKTFQKLNKFVAEFLDGRTWADFDKDMKYIVLTSTNGITVWDLETKNLLFENHHLTNGVGFASKDYFVTLWAGKNSEITAYSLRDLVGARVVYKDFIPKYEPCTGTLSTNMNKNLIVVGDEDGSISVYKFNPDKLEIELEWHPKPIVADVINQIGPGELILSRPEEIEGMLERYRINQLRIIEEDRRKGAVVTEYNKLDIQDFSKDKDKSNPGVTLTPAK